MSKTIRMAAAGALALLLGASPAMASSSAAGLTAGGFTIGGPGTTSLAAAAVQAVYTDASGNVDACVTISNTGRSAVRVDLTGSGNVTADVAAGATRALCTEEVELIELTCLGVGTANCTTQWRVDRD